MPNATRLLPLRVDRARSKTPTRVLRNPFVWMTVWLRVECVVFVCHLIIGPSGSWKLIKPDPAWTYSYVYRYCTRLAFAILQYEPRGTSTLLYSHSGTGAGTWYWLYDASANKTRLGCCKWLVSRFFVRNRGQTHHHQTHHQQQVAIKPSHQQLYHKNKKINLPSSHKTYKEQ